MGAEEFAWVHDHTLDAETRQHLRIEAIRRHLPLVRRCVNAARPRHDVREDVTQVAAIGLILAVDRFDPARGVPFTAFAQFTVEGEIRRYFRDRAPVIRLPRSYHEITRAVRRCTPEARHRLGREPQLAELADLIGHPVTVLEAALAAESTCAVGSLEAAERAGGISALRYEDAELALVPHKQMVRQSVALLPVAERRVIYLLFWAGLNQEQVAQRLEMSPMQVSRLVKRAQDHLRQLLGT